MPLPTLPQSTLAARLGLALAIGVLIGLEREWSNKDAGVRTFAIAALSGLLAAQFSAGFLIAGLAGMVVLAAFLNLHALRATGTVEITTSAALLAVYILGALVGVGGTFLPLAAAVAVTLLLAWKPELHRFAGALQANEIRGAAWMGVLAFVIYPLLPNRTVDPWRLVNPHLLWVAVIVVAAIGFGNYILMRLYSARGMIYSALLGGLVNSAATILELGARLREMEPALLPLGITVSLVATVAMLARNLVLLALFAPAGVATAGAPLAVLAAGGALVAWRRVRQPAPPGAALKLDSPLSLPRVLEFGGLFLAIQVATTLGLRAWGSAGAYAAALVGGVFSSAGATVAVGTLALHHTLTPATAGIATALASIAATLGNATLMSRALRQPRLSRLNLWLAAGLSLAALATLGLQALR